MNPDGPFPLRRIGELCDIVNGLAFKPEEWSDSGLPIIRIQNLNGSREFNFCKGVVPAVYLIEPGTLLFAWSGNRGTSFGPFWWDGPRGALNQHIFRVTPRLGIYPRWLLHVLQLAKARAEREAHGGSGLVHVRRADLLAYRLPTPEGREQSAIGAILDAADAAIERADALLAKLRGIRSGALAEVLAAPAPASVRDASHVGRVSGKGALPDVHHGWRYAPLGELLADRPANGYSPQEGDEYTGTLMLGLGCLTREGFLPRQLKNAPPGDSRLASALLRDGDLLISRSNTRDLVGLPGIYRETGVPCIYPDLMMRLVPGPEIEARFLELLLRDSILRRQIVAAASGTSGSMVKINATQVLSALVPVPPLADQRRIVEVMDIHAARIRAEEASRDKLKLLKRGLMDDLLTGRVRVPA